MLGGREPRARLRPGHQDRPLVGSIAGVRAAVPGQARPRLGGSSQALRRGRARARAGETGRSRAARGVLRERRPGRGGGGGRAPRGPRSRPGAERRQRGQRRAARAAVAGRGHLRRDPGGVARELAQRGGDLRRGTADDHARGLAAALRGQGPGRRRGVRGAARDGGAGTAGAGRVPAARVASGGRLRLGAGGRLPRGAAFVRKLTDVIVPLTGVQYEIEAGQYRATVTELGAGLRELAFRGQPLVVGYEADELPPAGAGQLLTPWPNRVDGGRYVLGGTESQLALTEPARGNAIHGLTRWAAWSAVQQDASAVRLRSAPHGQQGYPFGLEIEAEYRLDAGTGLQVTVAARNRGSHAAPYGTGSHPYLTVRTPSVDGCELTLPADSWLPMDDRGIPSGPPEPVDGTAFDFRQARVIGTTRLDHALTGLSRGADGHAWAYLAAPGGPRVGLWAGDGYRWLQVFTGDPLGPGMRRKAVAIEPMTCPPNAFVTADDLLVLEPGERVTHTWGIQAC